MAAGANGGSGADAASYRWTHTALGVDSGAQTAEQWLRSVWEDAPTGMRTFLRLGWRFGLGLRLGPADRAHVLGWFIESSSDREVVVSARSRILAATNTLTVDGDALRWHTDVRYVHAVARLVWPPAALVHQWIVPWSLRRTIRSLGRER